MMIKLLILDFSVYAKSSPLQLALTAICNDTKNEIISLRPDLMSDEDWDGVLDKILSARRCITL